MLFFLKKYNKTSDKEIKEFLKKKISALIKKANSIEHRFENLEYEFSSYAEIDTELKKRKRSSEFKISFLKERKMFFQLIKEMKKIAEIKKDIKLNEKKIKEAEEFEKEAVDNGYEISLEIDELRKIEFK